ncbi:MAG: DUF2461 family protein [Longimicrobiales bacterium]|nr:DUF2461 family protein [Longimicrobiales bacterium]
MAFQGRPRELAANNTRFSKDKSSYRTNVTLIMRQEIGKNVSAPGFYLRIDTKSAMVGTGIWQPDGPAVLKIRTAIAEDAKRRKGSTPSPIDG